VKNVTLYQHTRAFLEGDMKLLMLLLLGLLIYGGARLLITLIKELKEIAAEAWHSGETES
jgi:hypothetical protein